MVLEVGEEVCLTIELYCLLKPSAILRGLVRYLPLNLIALFSLEFGWPLIFLKNLKSFPGSDFLSSLLIKSRHWSRLCVLTQESIS